jgi:2-polyprenyl-3-methyl-5-hydroxy-6-metoxy-1,4-benzoquinol methylase
MNSYFITRNKCPACNSIRFKEIYGNPFTESPIREYLKAFYSAQGKIELEYLEGATYSLVECERCGLIFQREIPGEALMEILYEHWIDPEAALQQYENRSGLDVYAEYAENVMQIIAHFRTKPSMLSFLDYGMGWGKWAVMVRAFGCNSYGLDLSLTRRNYANQGGVTVLNREELGGHQFDFISADWVFEHIPEPLETLYDLRSVLKLEGLIRISVPTVREVDRRLKMMDWHAPKDTRNSLNAVAPLEHINCFRRETLLKMAAMAGMKEVHIRMDRHFQLARNLSGIRRLVKNVILPVLPVLKRDYILLARADVSN